MKQLHPGRSCCLVFCFVFSFIGSVFFYLGIRAQIALPGLSRPLRQQQALSAARFILSGANAFGPEGLLRGPAARLSLLSGSAARPRVAAVLAFPFLLSGELPRQPSLWQRPKAPQMQQITPGAGGVHGSAPSLPPSTRELDRRVHYSARVLLVCAVSGLFIPSSLVSMNY